MDTFNRSCPTRAALLSAWQSAAEIYSQSVAELTKKIGVVPKAEYDKMATVTEAARRRAMETQASLEAHAKEHRCDRDGGDGEVAA